MNWICVQAQKFGPLLARILLAQLFIVSGFGKIAAFEKTAAYMAGKGMPMANVLLLATIVLELGGGILLVLGWRARCVAMAFFVFTLITALIFHPFWSVDPAAFSGQLNNFMKNLSIMGGMLYVVIYGAGPLSLGGSGGDMGTNPNGKKPG